MFALLAGYRYRSAAVVTNEPAPTDPEAISLVDELRGQPGTRVPHVWVQHGGKRLSTHDLLGPAFTLLTGDNGAQWTDAAVAASVALGVPISVYGIGRDGDVVDTDGAWAKVTRLAPDGAVLVRPDDFVGWRADQLPVDSERQLYQALSTILARDYRTATYGGDHDDGVDH